MELHSPTAIGQNSPAGNRRWRVRWWLLLLICSVVIACASWMQTRSTVKFEVRAQAPVQLQLFYSEKGDFSESNSTRIIAVPATGGQVSLSIPASQAAYLRLDPSAGEKPFEVCNLKQSGSDPPGYRQGSTNQLSWVSRAACTRLSASPGSTDPFIVMIADGSASSMTESRRWRWISRLSSIFSVLVLAGLAWRLDQAGTPLSRRCERLFLALSTRAHWLAFVIMVMMGSLIAHALPPNGVPDEIAHLSKVAKVNSGVLLSDSGAVPVVDVFEMYANMNDVREPAVINPEALSTALSKPLACKRAVRSLPTMADSYAPHLYAVPAMVLSASCAMDASFGSFMTLSRIVNLLFAAALIAIGIRFASLGKWSLVAVGLLPMTLTQIASLSADSLTLSLSLCFIGLVSGIAGGRLSPSKVKYWLPVLALMLAFAKPGSAWILIAILFCRRAYVAESRSFILAVVTVLIVPWLVHAAWVIASSSGARPLAGVDPQANLELLRSDPLLVASMVYNTFFGPHGAFIYKSTLGLLGWLDVPLSNWAYLLGGIALFSSMFTNDHGSAISLPSKSLAVAAAAGSMAMLCLPLYLFWTHPSSGVVMGLQGRYFLPTLAFFLVWMAVRARPVLRMAMLSAILVMPLMTLDAVRHINDRYYLVGL